MDRTYLQEAFHAMELLNEETFGLDDAGIKDIMAFHEKNDMDQDDFIDVTDLDAEDEEDIKDTYIGDVILECEVCHSPIFKSIEDLVVDEDSDLVNIEEECPICHSNDGFKIIGQVAPYQEEPEINVEIEDKEVEEPVEDEVEESFESETNQFKTQQIEDPKHNDNTSKKPVAEELDPELEDKLDEIEDSIEDLIEVVCSENDFDDLDDDLDDEELDDEIEESVKSDITRKDNHEDCDKYDGESKPVLEDTNTKFRAKTDDGRTIEGDSLSDVKSKLMKHDAANTDKFGKDVDIQQVRKSGNTETVVNTTDINGKKKDESLREGFEKIDLETEDKIIHVSEEEKEPIPGAEMITPVSDELQSELTSDIDEEPLDTPAEEPMMEEPPMEEMPMEEPAENMDLDDEEPIEDADLNSEIPEEDDFEESLSRVSKEVINEAKDLLNVEGSVANKLKGIKDSIDNASSANDLKAVVTKALGDMTAPGAKKVLANIAKKKSITDLQFYLYNVMLAGAGEAVIKEDTEDVLDTEDVIDVEEPSAEIEEPVEVPIEEPTSVEVEPEEEYIDYDFDDFDDDTFNEIGESYLKKVYENVDSFKLSNVKTSGDSQLIVEGKIKFNSGKEKATSFIFEASEANKNGTVKFIGENAQITRGKKAFTLTGNVSDKKFISESLNYNYRVNSQRVYGTAKTNK